MSCNYKYKLGIRNREGEDIMIECGKCLSCMIKKTAQLEFLAKKELLENYKQNRGAAFITLTYTEDTLPYVIKKGSLPGEKTYPIYKKEKELNGNKKISKYHEIVRMGEIKNINNLKKCAVMGKNSLYKRDFQLFMKRLRQNIKRSQSPNKEVKVIYCGEYGGKTNRSHYHAILIGISEYEAKIFTNKSWEYGMIDIGVLAPGGLRYIVDYINKSKATSKQKYIYEEYEIQEPFIYHSVNLGKKWILEHEEEIIKDNFMFKTNKGQIMYPKYIINWIVNHKGLNKKEIYKNIFDEINNKTKNKRGSKTFTQYMFDEKAIKEIQNYEAIRSKGEVAISTKYLKKMLMAKKFYRPKTEKIYMTEKNRNLCYEAEKDLQPNYTDLEIF